ncbi:Spermidine/putrescine import ATP-binding protein PotA [Methyloligella halotolerans]|uniref:Spermidine/putrescine import ATP-binding protein PotA n=1 Tax=Methyloligella halotolerans TaxID=1177755 RepID=A0A1E2RX64_9HYPH|nr:ABC transporter ATP-binding protein [Methyloligella halotolerans]ODA66752.1 Spermidine/putrescine import ATP-binding protein PotA [Methyloligella halotolerans]
MGQNAATTAFAPWNDPDANPLIRFENVTKRFGDFTAVNNLNLTVYEREFFALLGASGCGKTTLLRMLAGFETPTSGHILLDGQHINGVPPNKRAVNMMFQSYALFPHLSVWDNIAFGLRRTKMEKDEIGDRVQEMLRLTQLEPFGRRKPHQLSGGQRQRVALARSLAKAPKLLLLDEPLAALDKKLRQETQFELMDIQEKTGTTFVIVTHDQEEAMTVASRVAVMNKGNLLQVATPGEIYEGPNSVYVADFIGEVNIIEGTAKIVGPDELAIQYSENAPPIHAKIETEGFSDGQSVSYAIRPEKIGVSLTQDDPRPNKVKGTVIDIAYLGSTSTYHVRLDCGQMFSAQMTNVRRIEHREITWEDTVWLSWSNSAGLVLVK